MTADTQFWKESIKITFLNSVFCVRLHLCYIIMSVSFLYV